MARSMKALAMYQVILLGEQKHIRCEQLAHGCCLNNAVAGVEPATTRSQVRQPKYYTTKTVICTDSFCFATNTSVLL